MVYQQFSQFIQAVGVEPHVATDMFRYVGGFPTDKKFKRPDTST